MVAVQALVLAGVAGLSGLGGADGAATGGRCRPERLSHGTVCMCSEEWCDVVEPVGELRAGQAALFTSSKAGKRLERTIVRASGGAFGEADGALEIEVQLGAVHQRVNGFGGAFTDAAAGNVLEGLSEAAQEQFFKAYFSREGLEYSMGRVHLGSCDFSRAMYSLAEVEGDVALAHFALRDDVHTDRDYKVDMIRKAQAVRGAEQLNIFSSVWSVPLWMKTCKAPAPGFLEPNHCAGSPTRLLGALSPDAATRNVYAQYVLKFFEAYRDAGVDLWGLTVQNEPSGDPLGNRWENTYFSARDMVDFVVHHLSPTLRESFPDVKIMVGDDQFPTVLEYAQAAAAADSAGKHIDGVAYHWYKGLASTLEDTPSYFFGLLGGARQVREASNQHRLTNQPGGGGFLLASEACNGDMESEHVQPGSWERGYRYMRDILHQMNNNASGWIDWNLALDPEGGPNHAGNMVDAPVIVVNRTHFYKNPTFYALGHFSKFVPPGSQRLAVGGVDAAGYLGATASLEVAAFLRPDGKIAVIAANDRLNSLPFSLPASVGSVLSKVLNPRPKLSAVDAQVQVGGTRFRIRLAPHEWQTLVIALPDQHESAVER